MDAVDDDANGEDASPEWNPRLNELKEFPPLLLFELVDCRACSSPNTNRSKLSV